ncbi:MAG: hypothetical protein IT361_06580 [Gemmatimonadaceae bacterium]|nr:hypothetical protein [Gemmatimonadaceae bacterium]
MSRFLFARLNLIAEYDDKRAFVLKGLSGHQTRKVRSHLWGFFEVEELPDFPDYVTGYLTKLKPLYAEEVGNLETHQLGTSDVANLAVAKSRFFLHIRTGIVAYHVISNHVTRPVFEEQFARLFEEGHQKFFVSADLQTIEARESFMKALASMERVAFLTLELHPTNPSFSEIYRTVDERLKRIKAKSYREEIAASREGPGLVVGDDEDVARKVTMAEDGYGRAVAVGTRNGKRSSIATSQNPVSTHADTRERSAGQILGAIVDDFAALFRRISE